MKSGIEHIVSTIPVPRSEFESEELHNLTHGNAFPASPVERQLFYRDDEHKWYIYNGTAWKDVTLIGITEAEADAKVAAHAALTTGVHGLGALHAAGFHTAGQAVSKVIWKDVSETALVLAGQTSGVDWTDLDLTAYTSANAKFAILRMYIALTAYTDGYIYLAARKNGTTPDEYPLVMATNEAAANKENYWVTIIGLDTGQVIEYKTGISGTVTASFRIAVLGYTE